MAFAVVQSGSAIHGNTTPGSVSLPGDPTPGNLIVAFIGCNVALASMPVNTTDWFIIDLVHQGLMQTSGVVQIVLGRYAQPGDVAAQPAFCNSGNSWWAHSIVEVSGVSGTIEDDLMTYIPTRGQYIIAGTSHDIPAIMAPVNGCLALVSNSGYNGNTAPTMTGTWTQEQSQANSGQFGSTGLFSRQMSAGDTMDGTISIGSADPYGLTVLLLGPAASAGAHVRTVYTQAEANPPTGTISLSNRPLTGSLMLLYMGWRDGSVALPTVTSDWTEFVSQTGTGGEKMNVGLYRYVQSGDTNVLPAAFSSGNNFYEMCVVEIANANGTFSNDHISDQKEHWTDGSPRVTISDTATADGQIGLTHVTDYDESTVLDYSGATALVKGVNNGVFGNWGVLLEYLDNGDTLQSTITSAAAHEHSYIQTIYGAGGGGPPPPTPTLHGRAFPLNARSFPISDGKRNFPRQ